MGRVRSSVGYLGNVSRLLLGELVVRTMKNLLRARFRRIMKEGGEKSESLLVAAAVEFLNLTTGSTEEGHAFLVYVAQGIRDRFGQVALTDGEAADLLSAVGPPYGYPLIIEHLLDRVGVTLTDTSRCRAGGWEGRARPPFLALMQHLFSRGVTNGLFPVAVVALFVVQAAVAGGGRFEILSVYKGGHI